MTSKTITSSSNAQFKEFKKLLEPKGLKKSDYFLMSGEAWIKETIKTHSNSINAVIGFNEGHRDLLKEVDFYQLDKALFNELDIFGSHSPLLLIEKPQINPWKESAPSQKSLMLALGEPSNLGAVLRSASAFGYQHIILLNEACSPFHPKAVRASAGLCLNFTYEKGPSIHDLSPKLENLLCLDSGGINIKEFKAPKAFYLLVGEEGPGIPSPLRASGTCLNIPMQNNTESLNAAVAISIAMFQLASPNS